MTRSTVYGEGGKFAKYVFYSKMIHVTYVSSRNLLSRWTNWKSSLENCIVNSKIVCCNVSSRVNKIHIWRKSTFLTTSNPIMARLVIWLKTAHNYRGKTTSLNKIVLYVFTKSDSIFVENWQKYKRDIDLVAICYVHKVKFWDLRKIQPRSSWDK